MAGGSPKIHTPFGKNKFFVRRLGERFERWFLRPILPVVFIFAPFCCAQDYVFQDHKSYIRRLAMDLMGTRPSLEDYGTPASDIEDLIDRYMQTESFGERMMWLANDIFLTRTDFIEYFKDSYDYSEERIRHQVAKAVGEEPLRLFEYIVRNNLPLTELVTADYTVANSTLAFFWNIEYDGEYESDQWRRGRYKDGRPHAGILSQTSIYYRYPSTLSNKQRHRANELMRILVDDDHLLRNVAVELRERDPDQDLVTATLTNPACTACHSSLDGIVAHLNGFRIGPARHSTYARENFTHYSLQGVERAHFTVGRVPSYYGYPSNGLKDLGEYIAADPRFARTMVKHFLRFLLHRDIDYRDRDWITQLTEVLRNNNYSPQTLIRAIVTSDEYRAVGVRNAVGKSVTPELPVFPAEIPIEETPPVQRWLRFEEQVVSLKTSSEKKKELLELARFHAVQSAYSVRRGKRMGHVFPKTADGGVPPAPPEERVQPFKLVTPEQLHSLGKDLVGEVWDAREGGQGGRGPFPVLEYNTGVKVAAGGYDGNLVLERRWTAPPAYMLVLERWAEVLTEDIYDRELRNSLPWGERRVFKVITGKEDPIEAEPQVKRQISNWFLRFYGEEVDPFGEEVQEIFNLLLEFMGREPQGNSLAHGGSSRDVRKAWQYVLEVMLCDPRIVMY